MSARRRRGHFDDHGRCGSCFTEWPCAVSLGTKYVDGVDAWANDEILLEALQKSNEQLALTRRCNRLLVLAGVDFEVPDFSIGVMVEVSMLVTLLERVVEEQVIE